MRLKRNLANCEDNPDRTIRGLIVASRISPKLRLAASEVPTIALREYRLSIAIADSEKHT